MQSISHCPTNRVGFVVAFGVEGCEGSGQRRPEGRGEDVRWRRGCWRQRGRASGRACWRDPAARPPRSVPPASANPASGPAVNKKMHPRRWQGRPAGAVWAASVMALALPAAHALFGEFLPPWFNWAWPALLSGSPRISRRRSQNSEVRGSSWRASRCWERHCGR